MVFGRLLTAMITPFDEDMQIDYKAAEHLACYLAGHGSDGIIVSGTTGESPTLTIEEKIKLVQTVKEAVGNRIFVLAGTGSNSTADSIEMTKDISKLGIDGVMLVTPYYNKPSQEGLYQHFKRVAQSTDLPVMLYNVPGRTGCNLMPETVARLSKIANIAAIKEASGNLEQISLIRLKAPDHFTVYSGDDQLTLPILSLGGCGVVSVASHIAGQDIKAMIDAWQTGNINKALMLHEKLLPLFKAMFITANPVPVKYALDCMGIHTGGVRLPLVAALPQEKTVIRQVLTELGILKKA